MIFIQNTQIVKLIIISIFSIIGLFCFFQNDGTILEFAAIYLFFSVVSKIANISYHRWLAHGYIKPNFIIRIFLYWSIVFSLLTRPIPYIIGHRLHHRDPDGDNDPHPPKIGFLRCLLGQFNLIKVEKTLIKDLLKNKELVFVDKHYYKLYLLNLMIFWAINPNIVFLSFLFLNLKFWIIVTAFNYISHGGKKIQSPINLNFFQKTYLGLLGEEFHRNHHENPSNPNFGREKKSFDMTFYILEKLGISTQNAKK